jgi:hypothetical protein
MPRRIDLEDYDFRVVPDGEIVRMGDSPTRFDASPILEKEREEVREEFEDPNDPFVTSDFEDDAWGASIISLDDIEDAQRRGIPLGDLGLSIRRRLKRRIKRARKAVRKVRTKLTPPFVSRAAKRVAKPFKGMTKRLRAYRKKVLDPRKFAWRTESKQHNLRKGLDKALKPVWDQIVNGVPGGQSLLEYHRRIADFIESVKTNQMPAMQISPPQPTAYPATEIMARAATLGVASVAASTAFNIGASAVMANRDKRLQSEFKKLKLEELDPNLNSLIPDIMNTYMTAGGLPPMAEEKPPASYTRDFEKRVRDGYQGSFVKGDPKKNPKKGWYYLYIEKLKDDLKGMQPTLAQAKDALQMSIEAYKKTTMPATVRAIGKIVEKLVSEGHLSLAQVHDAVAVLHKHQQGYVLNDKEQILFSQMAPYITASPMRKFAVGAGTAAIVGTALTVL